MIPFKLPRQRQDRNPPLICFVLALGVLLSSCLYGNPKSLPEDGDEGNLQPDESFSLSSEDGLFHIAFEAGSVDEPTALSIGAISREHYPDQPLLQGAVYFIEPEITLKKPATLTFFLDELEGAGLDLSQLYAQNALSVRRVIHGGRPSYLPVVEDFQESAGSPKRILTFSTENLNAFAVFIHQCYDTCLRAVSCPGYPAEAGKTPRQLLQACMADFNCPDDIEAINGNEMAALFACSASHPCQDSYGCCVDSALTCFEDSLDGDKDPDLPDGDEEADEAPPIDGDLDESEEGDAEEADGDPESDEELEIETELEIDFDFSPDTCIGDSDCSDTLCTREDRVSAEHGYCLPISGSNIRIFENPDGTEWDEITGQLPNVSCTGLPPESGTTGPSSFAAKLKIGDWWSINNLAGITVSIHQEWNLDTAVYSGQTDAEGVVALSSVNLAEEWFVVKTERASDVPRDRIVPTYNWGLWVSKAEAKAAQLSGRPIEILVYSLDANRYDQFATVLGIVDGVPRGYGMVLGQVTDCNPSRAHTLFNATVGFKELRPVAMAYFDNQLSFPTPYSGREQTTKNGLFAAIYLPPHESLTPFAYGRVDTGEGSATTLLGLNVAGHLKLRANTVSIVRFNRFH